MLPAPSPFPSFRVYVFLLFLQVTNSSELPFQHHPSPAKLQNIDEQETPVEQQIRPEIKHW